MNKIKLALKSKTAWTFVVLFLISGFGGVQDLLPENVVAILTPILTALGIYFRVNPVAEDKV